ncbi:MAG: hypothetical protein M5R42_12850 [Rhodocyclaceae bacterium]|nr:hypothetical protein [Rhodocyclaceae bacterium]
MSCISKLIPKDAKRAGRTPAERRSRDLQRAIHSRLGARHGCGHAVLTPYALGQHSGDPSTFRLRTLVEPRITSVVPGGVRCRKPATLALGLSSAILRGTSWRPWMGKPITKRDS